MHSLSYEYQRLYWFYGWIPFKSIFSNWQLKLTFIHFFSFFLFLSKIIIITTTTNLEAIFSPSEKAFKTTCISNLQMSSLQANAN